VVGFSQKGRKGAYFLKSLFIFTFFFPMTRPVRRSCSLKAKTSENVGIFVLALFAIKRNTPNSEKNESEMSQKRKDKRKSTIPVKV
jgi:hypothetical protein